MLRQKIIGQHYENFVHIKMLQSALAKGRQCYAFLYQKLLFKIRRPSHDSADLNCNIQRRHRKPEQEASK